MLKTLLTHPGTQYSHQLAKQLYRKRILYKFITGIVFSSGNTFIAFLNSLFPQLYRKISNRVIKDLPSSKIANNLFHELKYIRKFNSGKNSEENYFKRNEEFQQLIDTRTLQSASVIIGFDTSSWILINQSKQLNLPFILDVSIAHSCSKNIVYKDVVHQFPEWALTMEIKAENLLKKEQYEIDNSFHIVVASEFTKKTLVDNGTLASKISINPYGIDIDSFKAKTTYRQFGKIQFVFTGLVDARKGIPFLLAEFEKFNHELLHLSLVGPIDDKIQAILQANYPLPNLSIIGKIPHSEMPHFIAGMDVFIFPSYFEGFGLVILEAMASGLPVITTTATAGPDIIEHGKDGFIIEPGDKKGLTDAIQYFIDNPHQIEIMGRAARKKAEQYSWDAYGDRWEKIIHQVIEKANG